MVLPVVVSCSGSAAASCHNKHLDQSIGRGKNRITQRRSVRRANRSAKRNAATKAGAEAKSRRQTKTAGAAKAGNGKYYFSLARLKKVPAGTGYSTAHGGVVEGDRMLVGWIHKPRGTGSRMPAHKNEQFNYVVQGTLRCEINGVKSLVGPGTLIFVPANAPHTMVATPEADVIFIAIKDLSQSIIGKAVGRTMSEPRYEPGFAPRRARIARTTHGERKTWHKSSGLRNQALR
jgi:mannose-6-phosphate isomerase-like protein (cupin superfamily)